MTKIAASMQSVNPYPAESIHIYVHSLFTKSLVACFHLFSKDSETK